MRNAPEVVREVGVHDFRMATEQQLLHLYGGLLGVAPGAVGIDFRWKVGFEDRLQHQHRCRHADPIPHGRDAQRPEFAVGLRYERLLALRPAHSRGHQFVTRYPKASDISSPPALLRLLPAGAVAGWGLHPLESAALSRRTPLTDLGSGPCDTAVDLAAKRNKIDGLGQE